MALAKGEQQRPVGDAVHVADDQIGAVALVEERVGAPVHSHEHGADVADVAAKGGEVLAEAVPAHDDEHGPAGQIMVQLGETGAAEQEVSLLVHVLEGVAGEALEPVAERPLRGVHRAQDRVAALPQPDGDETVADVDPVPVQAQAIPLVHLVEQQWPHGVDERHAGLGEDQRPEVRVAAADRRCGVHDPAHSGVHEALGGHPVEVLVVDHGDVAGPQPLHEILRPAIDAGDTLLLAAAPASGEPAAARFRDGRGRTSRGRRRRTRRAPGTWVRAYRTLPARGRQGRRRLPGSATGLDPGRLVEQLLGVGGRALAAGQPREHAGDLLDTLRVGQHAHGGGAARPS